MNRKTDSNSDLVYASDVPDINALHDEYKRSTLYGTPTASISDNDDIRLCRWPGQSEDGKKYSRLRDEGDPAFPFEGASDVRARLIDRTINDIVAILMTTFDRCQVKVNGTEFNDSETAAVATTLMQWFMQRFRPEIRKEAELLAQYTHQYGWAAISVIWEREMGMRQQRLSMEDIQNAVAAAVQANPNTSLSVLPEAIMNPEQESYAVELISMHMPFLSAKDIKRAVKELREDGEAMVPEPYISKNAPAFVALKPFDEISFPPETIDIQRARFVFHRTFMTEVELRAKASAEDWDKKWVEEAVKCAGHASSLTEEHLFPVSELANFQAHRNENLIEIVYAYAKAIDEKGTVGIYQTIFCPEAKQDLYAKHELTGYAHNKYPFVIYSRERIRRPIYESRGIPELAMTDQEEIKAQHDSFRDRTALTTLPPILVKKRFSGNNRIAPGVHLPVTNKDDYTFMEPPRGDVQNAFALIERVEMNHANYFGLFHPNIPVPKTQTSQQFLVNNWLDVWSEAQSMAFSMMLQFMAPDQIEGITGRALPQNASTLTNQYDFHVKYDVRDLDATFVIEKLKAINQFVLPLDSGGAIDRNKLVKAAIEAIDPDKAKDLIIDVGTASQMLYNKVQTDLGLMMLGNEATYTENDTSAQAKLQYLQDIMSKNPKAQQAMQGDQHFRSLLDNYVKNLQMSVMQEQNKQIGRTGVTPVGEAAAQGIQGQIKAADEAQPEQSQF